MIKKNTQNNHDRLYKNSSNAEIFYASKGEYKATLTKSEYKKVDFKYDLINKNNNRRNRQRNIRWLNPPFSQTVSTNIEKRFLDLLDKHFPANN